MNPLKTFLAYASRIKHHIIAEPKELPLPDTDLGRRVEEILQDTQLMKQFSKDRDLVVRAYDILGSERASAFIGVNEEAQAGNYYERALAKAYLDREQERLRENKK